MNSIKWLFVCLLCFSVYLLCHISHGQYSLSIQAASCVAVAFARGRCRDSVVLNVAFSTVLPFCAWLTSLCALLWHQRQRQECFFCSREYTWINTSRKALQVFWKKLIYISMSICIVFSSRVLKYPKQGKSILVCFQCGSTLSRFSSGYEPLMQEAGASLFRESGSVFLLPPPQAQTSVARIHVALSTCQKEATRWSCCKVTDAKYKCFPTCWINLHNSRRTAFDHCRRYDAARCWETLAVTIIYSQTEYD